MKELALVIWVVGWPLSTSIVWYLNRKADDICSNKQPSEETKAKVSIIEVIIWIAVWIHLA